MFAERWEVVEPLASGSTSEVYRGVDRQTGEATAIKVMRPELLVSDEAVQRFVEEARITAQLDHPNIVPVHLLAHAPDDSPCLAMKLVRGRTLSAHLATLPAPPWPPSVLDEVLGIFLKVCDAVAVAHSKGVVHRDL